MSGYTALFGEIVTSSIWNEDAFTCKVWVTLLALADYRGNVFAGVAGLAPVVRGSYEHTEKAISKLLSPDLHSRSQEKEGRRIEPIEGGWHIVNYTKYRQKAQDRTEYYRDWRQEKRNKQKCGRATPRNKAQRRATKRNSAQQSATPQRSATQLSASAKEKMDPPLIPPVAQQPSSNKAMSYAIQQVKDACVMNGIPDSNAQSYFDQYNSQGWVKANGQVIMNLQSHIAKRWNKAKQCWDFDLKQGKADGEDIPPPIRTDKNGHTPGQLYRKQMGDPEWEKWGQPQ
jgi:hypothetical protein